MIHEKDYVMRLIRQLSAAIAKIMGLKADNKLEESQDLLNETFKNFTGLDKKVVEALPYEILMQRVSGGRQIDPVKVLPFIDLLYLQGDIYEQQGEMSKAGNLYMKALDIMLCVILNEDDLVWEENQEKIYGLIKAIRDYGTPIDTKIRLFAFYERAKNYAKAEDVLLEALDQSGGDRELLETGSAFYERLADLEPAALEKGNLPLDEVLEGLASLKKHRKSPKV